MAKDPEKAVKWHEKAAMNGDANSLGWTINSGEIAANDPSEELKWYRKAAETGNPDAQWYLGLQYRFGSFVNKDFVEAVRWYRKAAENGSPEMKYELGEIYASGKIVSKDSTEALKWFRKAAEQGDAFFQCNLAERFLNGRGVTIDLKEAAKWYRKAAEQGDRDGQCWLGEMYRDGEGVARDLNEAMYWFRKSAEAGNGGAQYDLGEMYEKGDGVVKDQVEALAWYYISAAGRSWTYFVTKNRDALERRLGQQAALMAQQRSKEILKQIEANKAGAGGSVTAVPPPQTERAGTPKATGSGAIVSSAGHVLTAAHVIADAARITVTTAQGTKAATVVRVDEPNDLAVLKIGGGTYSALPIASSRSIRLGQSIATIGFPNVGIQGFSPKLTRGEISSLNGIGDDPRSWPNQRARAAGQFGRAIARRKRQPHRRRAGQARFESCRGDGRSPAECRLRGEECLRHRPAGAVS